MCLLAQHPGQVFSREQIYEAVWHLGSNSQLTAVTDTIGRLRRKIEPDAHAPTYIKTVPMHGYRMERLEKMSSEKNT